MREEQTKPLTKCPYCGAAMARIGPVCWICKAELRIPDGVPGAETEDEIPLAEKDESPEFVRENNTFSLATLMALITLIAVGVGVIRLNFHLGALFAFICTVALIRTFTYVEDEQTLKGRNVGGLEKVSMFIVAAAITFGVLAAIVIAFFTVCAMMLPDLGY